MLSEKPSALLAAGLALHTGESEGGEQAIMQSSVFCPPSSKPRRTASALHGRLHTHANARANHAGLILAQDHCSTQRLPRRTIGSPLRCLPLFLQTSDFPSSTYSTTIAVAAPPCTHRISSFHRLWASICQTQRTSRRQPLTRPPNSPT